MKPATKVFLLASTCFGTCSYVHGLAWAFAPYGQAERPLSWLWEVHWVSGVLALLAFLFAAISAGEPS